MKRIFLISGLLSLAINLNAQTSTENYILSTTYLNENKTKKVQAIQYMDGLGRPKQSIAIKANPNGKDMVIPVEYDNYGRAAKSYLPLPVNSLNGNIQPIAGNDINDYYNTLFGNVPNAYAETVFDDSPLNRVKESAFPGGDWKKGTTGQTTPPNTVRYDYDTNSSQDGTIKKYTSPTGTPDSYAYNELYKFRTTDEDGNETYTFQDKQGHTILKRKINKKLEDNTEEKIDTYYIYNKYGQLRYIIPPEAAAIASMHYGNQRDLCYEYEYDSKNRLIKKKLPGKDEEYMVYDKQDRLIFYQDSKLASVNNSFGAKGWLFTKYDQFNRVVYTGFVASNDVRSVVQNIVNTSSSATNNESRTTTPSSYNGQDLYYTNNAFPTVITTLLSINYYDTYPVGAPSASSPVLGQAILGQNAQTLSISTKSFPTASFVKNIEDDSWTKTYTWYDTKGRIIASQTKNHLGGFTKTENELDFAGLLKKKVTKHSRSNPTTPNVTVEETFTYNTQNYLTKYEHEVVGRSPKETLAEYTYNDLGQVIEKKVGGTGVPLQTVNYKYNIRGWLTDINDIATAETTDDLFAYKIRYNDRQGLETPNVNYPEYKVKPRYNGNIAEVDWYVKDEVSSSEPYRYGYVYDNLDRLKAGFYQNPAGRARGDNHEIIEEYDLNGNIKKLKRFARKPKSTIALKIDDLTYNYSGNKVTSITDAANNTSGYEGGGGTIQYDTNGNMTVMPDKGITGISYNFLNLPTLVSQRGNESRYTYRADGTKIKRVFTLNNATGSTSTTTEYLGGFHYTPSSPIAMGRALAETDDGTLAVRTAAQEEIFMDSSLPDPEAIGNIAQPQIVMGLSFFPTAEGFYDYQNKKYIYQYKDQIGNVRLSYARNATTNELEIIDRNDYYPFGLNILQGAEFSVNGSPLNYKFQEQELQETGFYSFKWRNYDPTIGRFFNVDPLSEKYAYQSHYNFSENRVVNSREIEGLEAFDNDEDANESARERGLDSNDYYLEKNDSGGVDLIQNIEEVVITQSFNWDDFWVGVDLGLDLAFAYLNIETDTDEDFDFNYKMGGAERGWEATGRDYEGMGDDLLRDGDRVHAYNMDDFLTPTPSPNGFPDGFGYKFTWGFSAGAESFKDVMDFADRMGDKPGDTLVDVEATKVEPYGDHGVKLEDTIISVTVEKNDLNEYGYGNNPAIREQVDEALNHKK
ncbi:DUF6443 domain-containing protein [Epilithonimonas pallida]|uniref:RHS repeat-associated core domain-containing protein n=1 Tax=Epilithonimonas pallida TaxID=373671 RepID=A0ABY1QZY0_9FLAO|nr:DUF6443 domain-containing protein [Epilithonimonas pallida]SMP90447.1 RHS repeat-associated core domain-containing protein [Epilithonimonas pallida]